MMFESEDDAYNFYNSYARTVGFSIRKSHSRLRVDGTLGSKVFVCSNEGERSSHTRYETKKERANTRTGCKARLQFNISHDGIWTVQKVALEHNHYLASPSKCHMLRSQRHLSKADKCMVDNMRAAGIKPAEVFKFYEQLSGGAENVPFLQKDCNNYVTRVRKKYMGINDAQTLLEYLKKKQADDPSFFYAVQLDEEDGRIVNFFWTDGQAIVDYCCFGDVVSFDTTFQTNKFDMPFAPLLGTNHHRQTIVFAGALLYDESAESFVWLFRTFLTAMSDKHPTTIFTDQCAAIAKAISIVFPGTSHRLCLWHIYQNAAKHLSHVISNHPKFLADFKRCVYEGRSVSHFNDNWRNLLCAYNLGGNRWLQNLYALREKWATIYRRDSFCADVTSTQRSEGMNNVFKKAFRRKLSLSELIEQYDRCLNSLRRNELYEDYKSRHTNPILCVSGLPTLRTAAESYTRNMYSEFEKEFTKIFTMACTLILVEGTTRTYKVTSSEYIEDEATVVFHFEDMNTTCSCRMYECEGILCRHALRVLNFNNIFVLPPQYILNRWTKYAKRGPFFCNTQSEEQNLACESAHLSRKAMAIALKCKASRNCMTYFNNGLDKLASEIENMLSDISIKDNSVQCTEDVREVPFRVPEHKKGPKSKRARGVLEKRKKKASKTAEKGESSLPDVSFSQLSNPNTMLDNTLPSGEFTIHGEFTNLLFGAYHENTSVRRLDFEDGGS